MQVSDLDSHVWTASPARQAMRILVIEDDREAASWLVKGLAEAGHIVTRTMLLENVWDYHFDPQTNVIDVHISRLRAKIDKGHDEPILQTVRGAGYMIRDK